MKNSTPVDQFDLIEIGVNWCGPANLGSADCEQICRCHDGNDYAIKRNKDDPARPSGPLLIPHNEYFCYRLSHIVGLASPVARLVRTPDGLWFGSRWEGGKIDRWWDDMDKGHLDKSLLLPTIAKIYAFDLFVHNVDRHADNYLVRQQFHGPSVLAFDYSRAWTHHGFPLPALPMSPHDNTVSNQRYFTRRYGSYVTAQACAPVLDELERVNIGQIRQILNEQPPEWLPQGMRNAILYWWDSADRKDRIKAIRLGIQDGTLL